MIRIARMLAPVHSLGPGERVCLWVQGCTKNCPGCISPEMQPATGADVDEVMLAEIITKTAELDRCDGLTISGGDPFEQSDALLKLLRLLRTRFGDILVYTGFTIEEIRNGIAGASGSACLELIDVLIDGRYQEAYNRADCVLKGSENQKIYFFTADHRKYYSEYMENGRILETFCHNSDTIVTGIFNREDTP